MAMVALGGFDVEVARLRVLTNHFNVIFRIDAVCGERFVLRINRPSGRSLADIRSELAWLQALRREAELAVPEPVPARSGGVVQTIAVPGVPDPRHCVLFRWVDGRNAYRNPSRRTVEELGAALARLQNHADGFIPPSTFTRRRHDRVWPHGRPEAVYANEPDDFFTLERRAIIRESAERVERALTLLYEDPSDLRFLHADLHLGNVKLHRGALRLLDFDDSVWCHPIQDLAISLYYLHGYPNHDDLRSAFAEGYRSIRPWPEVDDRRLATFVAARELELIGFLAGSDDPALRGYLRAMLDRSEQRLRQWLGLGQTRQSTDQRTARLGRGRG
jgi:Ser/Thr protein kinase RdoA (MazF antagonist)